MDCPDGCPDNIYRIMQNCWMKNPSQRPRFTRIQRQLESKFFLTSLDLPKT
ncbi:MAG: protein kinase [Proteobacteria bacterium]|nr:protein kinase [Pseudomonadota bacterium]